IPIILEVNIIIRDNMISDCKRKFCSCIRYISFPRSQWELLLLTLCDKIPGRETNDMKQILKSDIPTETVGMREY
ncbi:MAG: hypothetical protein JXL81_06620, partial [Deltaproteobacteria bacterium]|nr:hypothetical protein [Deltaproteobacteria bacterium]